MLRVLMIVSGAFEALFGLGADRAGYADRLARNRAERRFHFSLRAFSAPRLWG
jgi:hypothetical protein